MKFTPKIPDVLVLLGRAVELQTTSDKYKWTIKDNCKLFSDSSGARLFILRIKPSEKKPSKAAKQATDLYKRWSHDAVDKLSVGKVGDVKLFKTSRANHIIYSSDKFGGKTDRYIHTFDVKPIVWMPKRSTSTVVLTGGKIEITKGGIEG
jgi:hypothetical protein